MPNIIKTKQGQYTIGYTEESRLDNLIDIVREEMGDEVADELIECCSLCNSTEFEWFW